MKASFKKVAIALAVVGVVGTTVPVSAQSMSVPISFLYNKNIFTGGWTATRDYRYTTVPTYYHITSIHDNYYGSGGWNWNVWQRTQHWGT
jgi:hypothetical protein